MNAKELLGRLCENAICGEISVYDCGDGAYMRLIKGAEESDFSKICGECEKLGYTIFQRNDLEKNRHASYNGNMLVHIYFCPSEKSLRVICDPFSARFECEEPKYERRCGSALWQFENDHSYIDCGMCYILRCADNSFFIIDSGHFLQPNDHKRIYRFLRERTPDGERTVISGWFFSHAHDDHVSQFVDFIREYGSAVEIERLYYNDAPIDHRDSMSWGESNKKYIRRFEDCARSCNIPAVKLHTGQRFFVRNLRFDVLCTQEDVWPQSLENFNNTSCVLALEADGTRIIFPGDAADVESDIMTARYTEKTLGCDIMQQSHHGHSGASPEFYRRADAKTVMFPITKIKFDEEYPKQEANRVACSIAEEYFIASDGTVEFPLPYSVGSAKVYPDETFENFAAIKMLWGYDYPEEYKKQLFEDFLRRGGLPSLGEVEA